MLNHVEHSSLDDILFSPSLDVVPSSKHRRHSHRRHSHKHSHKRRSRKLKNFHEHQCAVCLEEEGEKGQSRLDTKLFPCGHTFHGECLIQWAHVQKRGRKRGKFNCPLCRQDIVHFIQMTGNQAINSQLVDIWNEHNLRSASSSSLLSDEDRDKLAKFVEMEEEIVQKEGTQMVSSVVREETKEEEDMRIFAVMQESMAKSMEETKEESNGDSQEMSFVDVIEKKEKVVHFNKSNGIWKFLWNSPLSLVSIRKNRIYNGHSQKSQVKSHEEFDEGLVMDTLYGANRRQFGPFANQNIHRRSNDGHHSNSVRSDISETAADIISNQTNDEESIAFWRTTPVHFKAGLWAGLCAGTTTYFLHGGRSMFSLGALRGGLFPILSETIPSVAIFFTSYEHCKRYLFAVDNVENSHSATFCHRFISAGIASSLGCALSTNVGLLPFRFATFFGTFELCKDVMNVRHERLNLPEVASAAAIGGTVSHGLYYPLLQSTLVSPMETVSTGMAGTGTGSMMARQVALQSLYKGWVSSAAKFLPSCVVCSCAFEYGKRYLSQ